MEMNYLFDFMKELNYMGFKTSINSEREFIVCEKTNTYFRLKGIEEEIDFKCKIISWLSRPVSKGLKPKERERMLIAINKYLETDFSKEDFKEIYVRYGCSYEYDEIKKFIVNGYKLK